MMKKEERAVMMNRKKRMSKMAKKWVMKKGKTVLISTKQIPEKHRREYNVKGASASGGDEQ